ncbi:MAG: amidophosphoribosyltransferase [Armatimonadota bacterium]|nr:amidophosphoribosyltransferase [Armatimonadota bacterium]
MTDLEEYRHELQEECGVFGVYAPGEDVSRVAFFGIFSLQHRGQESAGIAVTDGKQINIHKQMGLVTQVFQEDVLASLKGDIAIGHTRYSTTGSSVLRNVQPMLSTGKVGDFALAHNGDLVNAAELRADLMDRGVEFSTTNDSEVIAKLIANSRAHTIEEAIIETMGLIRGAYSVLVMTEHKLMGFRDPNGIRPLCIGKLNDGHMVMASETCAIATVGADFVREVEPGELVVIDENGLREIQALPVARRAICIFEFIYFARPDSTIYAKNIHAARRRMGHELAKEHSAPNTHMVFPIPDTGTPAAIGFAQASRTPYAEGVIKNRYIHRTFIQPDQRMREMGVRMKLSPLKENLAGKRVVMVEDSIVRGTTTRGTVRMLKEAGAAEVHVRISSPPYKFPCFFGIDTANQNELIAAKHTVEEIRQHIGADSLGYLSLKGLVNAIGLRKENFCTACLDGKYPIDIPREARLSKFIFEMLTKEEKLPDS